MLSTAEKIQYFINKINKSNFANHLRIEATSVQPGAATAQMPVAEEHMNPIGSVHGGVIMTFADTAMGYSCVSYGKFVTTLDMNINFIKSAKPEGFLKANAIVIHHGRQTMVSEAEICDSQGQLLAKTRGTFFIIGEMTE